VSIERGSETVLELAKKANVNLEIPKPWELLTGIAKDAARGWFVKRAEEKGIPWNDSVASMEAIQPKLDALYSKIYDPTIEYPEYYTQAFHGYDEGNLNWKAAHELEAATFSMCLGYYDGVHWKEAQEMFRGAARSAIVEQWRLAHGGLENGEPMPVPKSLLDVGCSGGFSTHQMAQAFPGVEATGIDLSPHYLSVASSTYPDIRFMHRMAEDTKFPDNSYDVVTLNFILHELPLATSKAVLQEAHRILKPGGVLAVLDVDPRRLLELPPLRRWAFQVTEPWCKEGEYYSLKAENELNDIGFRDVSLKANDPVNAMWLATK
jgi:ubiquinone/menaquinone biosynthesis C-methylase UbiE